MISSRDFSAVCVVGAGSSGLAAARWLLACGFMPDVFERSCDLGGIWNINLPTTRVYRSTRMISSKRFTQFPDHPMPRHWPDYPHHSQVLEYLRRYAERFHVTSRIEFNTPVDRIEPAEHGSGWRVTLADGRTRDYAAVVIANGHNWHPNVPKYPGEFTGRSMHSAGYRGPDSIAGERVLVVGAGNSGCDIAVEAAQHGADVSVSMRRGYHFIPKYIFGRPSDRMLDKLAAMHIPLRIRRLLAQGAVRLFIGNPARLGLPRPDHPMFQTHPIINSLMPYYVAHGAVKCRPDIERFDGETVRFVDGSAAPFDTVMFATGYQLVFPFIDSSHLNWRDGRPRLFLNIFHPASDTIFVAGMIQPDSGQFGLVHLQSQAIARFLSAARDGSPAADRLRQLRSRAEQDHLDRSGFAPSSRHALEVEHWGYMKQLTRICRMLQPRAAATKPARVEAEAQSA